MIRCAHSVYHVGVKHSGKTNNPACSLCCAPTVRDKPGALTVAANAEAPYRRKYAYDPWYDLPAVADKVPATDNPLPPIR